MKKRIWNKRWLSLHFNRKSLWTSKYRLHKNLKSRRSRYLQTIAKDNLIINREKSFNWGICREETKLRKSRKSSKLKNLILKIFELILRNSRFISSFWKNWETFQRILDPVILKSLALWAYWLDLKQCRKRK